MKRVLFSLIALFFLSSCSYVERDFIGRWQVTDVELVSEWRGNTISEANRESLKRTGYEFRKDGKLIYFQGSQEVEGTWKLRRGEYIDVRYQWEHGYFGFSRDDLSYKVHSCSGARLTLSLKFNEDERWILYLKEVDER